MHLYKILLFSDFVASGDLWMFFIALFIAPKYEGHLESNAH